MTLKQWCQKFKILLWVKLLFFFWDHIDHKMLLVWGESLKRYVHDSMWFINSHIWSPPNYLILNLLEWQTH